MYNIETPCPKGECNTIFHYWWMAHAVDNLVDAYERTGLSLYAQRLEQLYDGLLERNGGWWINSLYDDMEWPFYVMKYPVTKGLYHEVMFGEALAANERNLPITEVSWMDTIVFCNRLSTILSRTECYTIHTDSEHTEYNHKANGFRLLTDAEWQ